jgi:hypothetical protein
MSEEKEWTNPLELEAVTKNLHDRSIGGYCVDAYKRVCGQLAESLIGVEASQRIYDAIPGKSFSDQGKVALNELTKAKKQAEGLEALLHSILDVLEEVDPKLVQYRPPGESGKAKVVLDLGKK